MENRQFQLEKITEFETKKTIVCSQQNNHNVFAREVSPHEDKLKLKACLTDELRPRASTGSRDSGPQLTRMASNHNSPIQDA